MAIFGKPDLAHTPILTDDEIVAIRKAAAPRDYEQPWADTVAFGRAVAAATAQRLREQPK